MPAFPSLTSYCEIYFKWIEDKSTPSLSRDILFILLPKERKDYTEDVVDHCQF